MTEDKNWAIQILSDTELPLFEIILTLIILSFFWLLYLGDVFSPGSRTGKELNKHRMILLSMALQSYHWANHSFPSELGALVCAGQDARSCISVGTPELLRDAWGASYSYRSSGESFVIESLGEDMRRGGRGPAADMTLKGP